MRRAAVLVAVLGMGVWSLGQDKPAAQNPPAGQTAAAPQGKRPPKVNSQDEYKAYQTTLAMTDPAAEEKAVADFVAKYPQSELHTLIYNDVMGKYQNAGNNAKCLEMARKTLAIDPDDPVALVTAGIVIVEQVQETDLDKDQRYAEAKKDAQRALVTVDTDIAAAMYPPDKLENYKNLLRSQAYSILGSAAFKQSVWPDAEVNLRKSIDAYPQSVDVVCVYRLALALDFQNKIPEALKAVQQAVDLTKDSPDSPAGKAARQEQNRLLTYSKTPSPGQTSAPPKN